MSDTDGGVDPNIVTIQERVPRQDLGSGNAVLSSDRVTIVVGFARDGLRACGGLTAWWDADGCVDPDVVAVQEPEMDVG